MDNELYKIVLGRNYLYMIDYTNTTYHRVKQNITLLDLFSYTMSKSNDHATQLVKTIKTISIEETKQHNLERFKHNNKK